MAARTSVYATPAGTPPDSPIGLNNTRNERMNDTPETLRVRETERHLEREVEDLRNAPGGGGRPRGEILRIAKEINEHIKPFFFRCSSSTWSRSEDRAYNSSIVEIVDLLKRGYPNICIQIEGHCDKRSLISNNYDLAEKRAEFIQERIREEYERQYRKDNNRASDEEIETNVQNFMDRVSCRGWSDAFPLDIAHRCSDANRRACIKVDEAASRARPRLGVL